jgi:hypothetical protein
MLLEVYCPFNSYFLELTHSPGVHYVACMIMTLIGH